MLRRAVLLPFALLALATSPALGATLYVNGAHGKDRNNCKTNTKPCATIHHAISLASSGDTIEIAAATYNENLSIPFNLTLNGANAKTVIVNGNNKAGVMTVGAGISLSLANLTIEKGLAFTGGGGGIANAGTLSVSNTNFNVNTALSGGALLNTGTATISNATFASNTTYFSGHSASCGAIDNQGPMTIANSTFANNFANNNYTYGGAICNGSALTITGSTFNSNQSQGNNGAYGGAIYAYGGTLAVTNSTFYLNSAGTSGGAIYNDGGTVEISNSTFGINAENIGGGGALANASGTVKAQNIIVANNGSGGNCAGAITSFGYNLSSDASCAFANQGDLNNGNPMLGALANNGGPTQTMALQKGSQALDAGNPGGCTDFSNTLLTTDQRGDPRPGGGETSGCDMGAYESQTL